MLGLHNRAFAALYYRSLGMAQYSTLAVHELPLCVEEARPLFINRNTFCVQLYTSCKLLNPLSGIRRLSAIQVLLLYYIYGDFGWYIWLFSRSPLFGVFVNRESTVYVCPSRLGMLFFCVRWCAEGTGRTRGRLTRQHGKYDGSICELTLTAMDSRSYRR